MATRKVDPFAQVKLAKNRLRMVVGRPMPALPAIRGATADDRMRFVADCFSLHRQIADSYGWCDQKQDSFGDQSLLCALLGPTPHATGAGALRWPCAELGDPPSALLCPNEDPAHWALGIEPLTRSDLRVILGGFEAIYRLRYEGEAEPLSDSELYGIAKYADVWVTYSPQYWEMIVAYLRRQLTRARSLAFDLIDWVEQRLNRTKSRKRGLSQVVRKSQRAWVDKALKLMRENQNLSAHAVAKLVGVAVSTITKHPVLGVHFKRHPKGALGESIGAEVLDGDEHILTGNKLPARPTKHQRASE